MENDNKKNSSTNTSVGKQAQDSINLQLRMDLDELQKTVKALNDEFYSNNFSAHQDFNKSVSFTSRLKVPHYASLPATCEAGELAETGGVLKVCSATNTWTTVGTQT